MEDLAKKTGRTKSYYAKLAIEEFLKDQEDYLIAASRLEHRLPSLPLKRSGEDTWFGRRDLIHGQ